ASTRGEQTVAQMTIDLRVQVVDIGGNFYQVVSRKIGGLMSDNYPQHVGPVGEIFGSGAIANTLDFVCGHRRRRTCERLQDRRSSGSNHLGRPVAKAHRE